MNKKSKLSPKKNIAAIITIRLNSSRLKNKALKKINNLTSAQILIKRLKKLNNISNIILATSPHKDLSKLREICEKEKINFFVGSEKKVLKRIILCATKFKVDSVIRITGDDIFRDIINLDNAILSHKKSNKDITVMKNIPYGLDSEIFNLDVLKIIDKKHNKKCDSSYLSWFIDRKIFNVNNFDCKYSNYDNIILSLDYKIDLAIMRFIHKNLGTYFTTDKLLNFYFKNKKKFISFKVLRKKIESEFDKSHHPLKKDYKLNI
jgi:spore coat polysaccharide biosynthesis protein SpsF (cytidylyltransferase family)